MFVPLSCHSLAQHAQDASFVLMLLHSCPGTWQRSLRMMTRQAQMTKTQLQLLQLLQPHLELQCPSTATRHPCLPHLAVQSRLRLLDWVSHLDLSHPGAQAALPSLLIGSLLITSAHHRAVQRYLAPLLTQPFHFRHSQSCHHSHQ